MRERGSELVCIGSVEVLWKDTLGDEYGSGLEAAATAARTL